VLKATFFNILATSWTPLEGSFIGRGNWSTKRKPATCRKKLVNYT